MLPPRLQTSEVLLISKFCHNKNPMFSIPGKKEKSVAAVDEFSSQIWRPYFVFKKRRWLWHVCKTKLEVSSKIAIRWTADGERKRSQPRETRKRSADRTKRPETDLQQVQSASC